MNFELTDQHANSQKNQTIPVISKYYILLIRFCWHIKLFCTSDLPRSLPPKKEKKQFFVSICCYAHRNTISTRAIFQFWIILIL